MSWDSGLGFLAGDYFTEMLVPEHFLGNPLRRPHGFVLSGNVSAGLRETAILKLPL